MVGDGELELGGSLVDPLESLPDRTHNAGGVIRPYGIRTDQAPFSGRSCFWLYKQTIAWQ